MKKFSFGLLLLLYGTLASANPSDTTKAEIDHLFSYLGKSGCQFSRNGSWYSPSEAVDHLQTKYQYLLNRNLVSSTEDFIARAASESSMSGKPYLVKCGNAAPMESAMWFRRELIVYRQSKK